MSTNLVQVNADIETSQIGQIYVQIFINWKLLVLGTYQTLKIKYRKDPGQTFKILMKIGNEDYFTDIRNNIRFITSKYEALK